jgi:hypothetical protein
MCLCGTISAEIGGLPRELTVGIGQFFNAKREWLGQVLLRCGLPRQMARQRVLLPVATLEVALLIYLAKRDLSDFVAIVRMAVLDAMTNE